MADQPGKMTSDALDIGMVASDLKAMIAFYEEGLGMPRIEDIELPGIQLIQFKAGSGIVKFNQTSSTPDPAPAGDLTGSRGMKLLTIVAPDLQVISKQLQSAGFSELEIQDHGQYTLAFIPDPSGSLIELAGAKGFGPSPVLQAVGITVGDIDASRTFLTEVLGFTQGNVEAVPSLGTNKHEFSAGATTLKLWQIDGLDARTGPIQDHAGIRYLTAEVDDIDAVLFRARDAGQNIPLGPVEIAPGVQIAMVEDPDGNWFELVQRKQA
jgi:catechol 2,3-dioxygenase-like lactoylglutathione lyase family enzyme